MQRVHSAEPRSAPADRPSRQSALAESGKHPVHGRRRPEDNRVRRPHPLLTSQAVKTAPAPSAVPTGGPPTNKVDPVSRRSR